MDDLESILFSRRGGVKAVAEAARISSAAVSQWKKNGIPKGRRSIVAKALGILTAENLESASQDPA